MTTYFLLSIENCCPYLDNRSIEYFSRPIKKLSRLVLTRSRTVKSTEKPILNRRFVENAIFQNLQKKKKE